MASTSASAAVVLRVPHQAVPADQQGETVYEEMCTRVLSPACASTSSPTPSRRVDHYRRAAVRPGGRTVTQDGPPCCFMPSGRPRWLDGEGGRAGCRPGRADDCLTCQPGRQRRHTCGAWYEGHGHGAEARSPLLRGTAAPRAATAGRSLPGTPCGGGLRGQVTTRHTQRPGRLVESLFHTVAGRAMSGTAGWRFKLFMQLHGC